MRFDVLSRDVDVFAPHFLEASAGTGKTFAIEHLVARLILEGVAIEEALVVTFTRAATRELKLRIRRNLARAKEQLETQSPEADYLAAICEKGEAALKEALSRIEAALICYDQAQIYTLHGFCHRILKEFAFEAGINLEVSDPDENDHIALLEQMVKDHLKESIQAPHYSPMQMQRLLNRDPKKLIQKLVGVLSNGKEIAPLPSFEAQHAALQNILQTLPQISAELFAADIEALSPNYKRMGDEVSEQAILLGKILESKTLTHAQFDHLLRLDLFLVKLTSDNLKVRAKLPTSLLYPGLVHQLLAQLLPLVDAAKDPSKIFLRLARELKEKRDALLETQEKFSPDDLLLKVEKALELPKFVERVREKYRAAIIDEFQDTDPVQWNIFQKLFLAHNTAVTLVGDPKQSIYGFRNADVYTYLQAAEAMGEKAKKHLDTNYRSTPALVAALNLLFSKADWMRLPGHGSLSVLPMRAGKPSASNGVVPVTFFQVDGKQKKNFPFIASEIIALAIPYHEIAILVKDRYQGANVVEYLKSCGIPANFKRGGSLIDSIAYAAFKEVLAAVCFPYDMGKIKAALGSPLIGWTDDQLRNSADALLTAKAQMQALNTSLVEKGMGPFFKELLNTSFYSGRPTVLENLLCSGDLSLYLDLRKLSELLIEEEILRGLKTDAFLLFLNEIAADAHHDESRLKTPSQEEKGSVTVMTMHMSKGLEFDAVFALGAASRHKISEQIVVKKVITPFDPADPACRAAIEELEAEKLRQLYVALTRAKSRLYIPLMVEEGAKPPELGEASPIELFFSALGGDAQEIFGKEPDLFRFCQLEEVAELPKIANAAPIELPPLEPLHLPRWDEQLFSFTKLAKKDHSSEHLPTPLDTSPSPHTLPHGSETGHVLHLLFEKIFKRGLNHLPEAIGKIIDEQIAFSALQPFQSILLPWILDLLNKPIAGFCLADVTKFQQEMEFFFPVPGGMMKGFADLFFEHGGKYYLLDWKSNYLGPTDADYTDEKIIAAMRQNDYFLQAKIYAEALKRFVKLFDNRPFSECFGGAVYYFVRGRAPYHFIPEVLP